MDGLEAVGKEPDRSLLLQHDDDGDEESTRNNPLFS